MAEVVLFHHSQSNHRISHRAAPAEGRRLIRSTLRARSLDQQVEAFGQAAAGSAGDLLGVARVEVDRQPSIYVDDLAGDVGRSLRRQEKHGFGDLRGVS